VSLSTSPVPAATVGIVEEMGRSNMAAVKCARENVLQDKDTRFVNNTYIRSYEV